MTKIWRKKLQLEKIDIFLIKKCNLPASITSYRRSLEPSKENIQHLKTWNVIIFKNIFVSYFYPPGSRSGSSNLIESGSGCGTANLIEFRCNPDPKHWLFKYIFIESGSDPAFFVKKASMRNFRSSRRCLQPSMEKVQLLIWIFYLFFLFCVCLPSLISIWKLDLETGSPLYLDNAILIRKIG